MGEQGKVENRRTAVRLVRLYVQLFFYIGCCCASPVVWCKQKHICASLCRCVCSMVTYFCFLPCVQDLAEGITDEGKKYHSSPSISKETQHSQRQVAYSANTDCMVEAAQSLGCTCRRNREQHCHAPDSVVQ